MLTIANKITIIALALLGGGALSMAQDDIQQALFTVGTTTDVSGSDYAYLFWQATDDSLLKGERSFAIYKKPGTPASPGDFNRISITRVHNDPALVTPLIARSEKVGQDVAEFDGLLTEMFEEFVPDVSLSTAVKFASVVQGAIVDDELRSRLFLFARRHPAAALALGQAWVEPVSGVTTFEVREWDTASKSDLAVVGRVTLDPANPVTLPAPASVFDVPNFSPKGHLNIRLRWATPEPLRRLSLLSSGFDVFRLTKARAIAEGWTAIEPPTAAMLALVAGNPDAKLVNRVPVILERDLNAIEAVDGADTETWFISDDNDRFKLVNPGPPLVNGDEYYYYVAARDILGRPGGVSRGRLAVVCDTMPPPPPQGVWVSNHYEFSAGTGKQHLQVNWPAAKEDPDSGNLEYHVYRWESINEKNLKQLIVDPITRDPFQNRIAIVPHVVGQELYSVVDDGFGAPFLNKADPGNGDNAGETFWYSVRLKDNGACGGNWSGNSAPQFGVLRDRRGPLPPSGRLDPCCWCPDLVWVGESSESAPKGSDDDLEFYEFRVTHEEGAPPEYAEFFGPGQLSIGTAPFEVGPSGVPLARLKASFLRDTLAEPQFFCRTYTRGRKASPLVSSDFVSQPGPGEVTVLEWSSSWRKGRSERECGPVWEPVDPVTGTVTGPGGTITTTLGTREYKIYRRIDDGRLTMILQGTLENENPQTVVWEDPNPPSTPGKICYFVQAFDKHGNASPMILLKCLRYGSNGMLPTPMLSPVVAAGIEGNEQMTISWFCSPYGVERFELWLAIEAGPLPVALDSNFSGNLATAPNPTAEFPASNFGVYETRRIGKDGVVTPQFSYTLPAIPGFEYKVMVRSVGPGDYGNRTAGEFSNAEDFIWEPSTAPPGPDVPWPPRPLPAVTGFHPGVKSVFVDVSGTNVKCPAVRIGEVSNPNFMFPPERKGDSALEFPIGTTVDPLHHLFVNAAAADNGIAIGNGKNLFPVVMFRYQVPTATRPEVSGDIVQVSPLMEQIAYGEGIVGGLPAAIIRDPYVVSFEHSLVGCTPSVTGSTHSLFLLDTQPVIRGAAYKYLLVRLGARKEIDRVIDCGTVAIP